MLNVKSGTEVLNILLRFAIITIMDKSTEQERKPMKSPSLRMSLLSVIVMVAALLFAMELFISGEFVVGVVFLLSVALAYKSLSVLRERRDQLLAWPVWVRCVATFAGLGGALGMAIQTMNFGVMATYFTESSFWAGPLCMLCFVLSLYLPCVVVLMWLARRERD